MPFFSIIIATFNSQKTLKRTLESIINQSFSDYEIIIVDGDSTDKTMTIVNSYEPRYFGYLVSEPDNGIYDAWNKGISVAKGKWMCFIGSDDYLIQTALTDYYNVINSAKEPLSYVSSKVQLTNNQGKQLGVIGKPWSWQLFKKYMCVAHVGSMHHNSLFENYGLYDTSYKSSGDYEFLLRIGENLNADFLDKVTASMEYGGTSASIVGLLETYKAKVATAKIPKYRAYIEYLSALLRHRLRMFIYEGK